MPAASGRTMTSSSPCRGSSTISTAICRGPRQTNARTAAGYCGVGEAQHAKQTRAARAARVLRQLTHCGAGTYSRRHPRWGRFLMIRREITTSTDRLFSRRRFIYYGAAFAAAVACGPAAAPAPAAPAASPSGPVQLKGTKVNLLHWTSFVPDEDKWIKEMLVAD